MSDELKLDKILKMKEEMREEIKICVKGNMPITAILKIIQPKVLILKRVFKLKDIIQFIHKKHGDTTVASITTTYYRAKNR